MWWILLAIPTPIAPTLKFVILGVNGLETTSCQDCYGPCASHLPYLLFDALNALTPSILEPYH